MHRFAAGRIMWCLQCQCGAATVWWMRKLREAAALWNQPLRVWQWHGDKNQDLRSTFHMSDWKRPMLDFFEVLVVSYRSFLANQLHVSAERWACALPMAKKLSMKDHVERRRTLETLTILHSVEHCHQSCFTASALSSQCVYEKSHHDLFRNVVLQAKTKQALVVTYG